MNNLRAIGALALLDLRLWLKNPTAIVSALLPPLGMALLLAVLAWTVGEQPVALVVESHGPYAGRMEKLIRADDEAFLLTVTDSATAERLLRDQVVAAIITIPADFDRKASGYDATLYLKLNNVDIDFADDIRRSIERSAGQFDAPGLGLEKASGEAHDASAEQNSSETPDRLNESVGGKETESDAEETADQNAEPYTYYVDPAANPYHINVAEHDLRVTNVDFLHYQLIPALVLLALNIGMTGTAMASAADVERGTARYLLLAPVSAWALVAGRLLGGLLATLAGMIPVVAVCAATHTIVAPSSHWAALAVLFLMISFCAAGLGAALGTVVRGARNVAMGSSVLATYLFLMGGGFTTIAFLPQWLRNLSSLDPLRYAIDALRQALFYPDLTGFPADLAVLSGTAFAAVLLGAVMVARSWKQ